MGGNNERTTLEIVHAICDVLDRRVSNKRRVASFRELITFVPDRPGHDRRYAIDATKIGPSSASRRPSSSRKGLSGPWPGTSKTERGASGSSGVYQRERLGLALATGAR